VILPAIGVVDDDGNANGNAGTVLVDDFRGHGKDNVRERVASIPRLAIEVCKNLCQLENLSLYSSLGQNLCLS